MKKVPFLILSLAITSVLVSGTVVYLQRNESSSALNATLLNIPGIAVAAEKGCTACHSLDGAAGIGPSWKGTYGTPRIMTDGARRMVDDAYLRKSMLEPAAEVVTGFANVMIPPELSEEEITQLIQLIRQLGTSSSG